MKIAEVVLNGEIVTFKDKLIVETGNEGTIDDILNHIEDMVKCSADTLGFFNWGVGIVFLCYFVDPDFEIIWINEEYFSREFDKL